MALPFGVPILFGNGASFFSSAAITILTSDTLLGYGAGAPPLWGIYQNGAPVVIADTVTELDYRQEWSVADYPVERGGFESYDKVNTPFRIRIRFASGGSVANREALLASIAAIGDTLDLFDVVTPEAVYTSVNVERYDYRRSATNGLGLMIVDIDVLEIREDPGQNFQNTVSPSGFAAAPTSSVQSQTTTQSVPTGVM
jgi:hypothetical protein